MKIIFRFLIYTNNYYKIVQSISSSAVENHYCISTALDVTKSRLDSILHWLLIINLLIAKKDIPIRFDF